MFVFHRSCVRYLRRACYLLSALSLCKLALVIRFTCCAACRPIEFEHTQARYAEHGQPEQIRRTLLDLNAPQRSVAAILLDYLVEPIQEALYHLGAIDLVQDLVAALSVARQRRV